MKATLDFSPPPAQDWWRPVPGLTWQWHISEPPVDTGVDADVYDIDLFDNEPAVIDELHRQQRKSSAISQSVHVKTGVRMLTNFQLWCLARITMAGRGKVAGYPPD